MEITEKEQRNMDALGEWLVTGCIDGKPFYPVLTEKERTWLDIEIQKYYEYKSKEYLKYLI